MPSAKIKVPNSRNGCRLFPLLAFLFFPVTAQGAESLLSRAGSVGVLAAMNEAPGLELRDAHNRAISRDALAGEVRAASRRVEDAAADLSRVKGLRDFLRYLEAPGQLAHAWRGGRGNAPAPEEISPAPPPSSPKIVVPELPMLAGTMDNRRAILLSPLELSTTPGRVRVLPKRE